MGPVLCLYKCTIRNAIDKFEIPIWLLVFVKYVIERATIKPIIGIIKPVNGMIKRMGNLSMAHWLPGRRSNEQGLLFGKATMSDSSPPFTLIKITQYNVTVN